MNFHVDRATDIQIGPLSIWIEERLPDGWLNGYAVYVTDSEVFHVRGEFLEWLDISLFFRQCRDLLDGRLSEVLLSPAEPNLFVRIIRTFGAFSVTIEFRVDPMAQKLIGHVTLSEGQLEDLIEQCGTLLARLM